MRIAGRPERQEVVGRQELTSLERYDRMPLYSIFIVLSIGIDCSSNNSQFSYSTLPITNNNISKHGAKQRIRGSHTLIQANRLQLSLG